MLNIGLTGGIAAGKSFASRELVGAGAVLIDADALARDALASGSEGLRAVVKAFGTDVLAPDGTVNRTVLGERVFSDHQARSTLNGIVHPIVRRRAAELREQAPADSIVVEDIPLLVETRQSARFHLVIDVDVPTAVQESRLMSDRGLTAEQARSRIQAQAHRDERRAGSDVILENSASYEEFQSAIRLLWQDRLVPFNSNLLAGRQAGRGPAHIRESTYRWAEVAALLQARIMSAVGSRAIGVQHIGSTSVPGLAAKDVIDLQLLVPSEASFDSIAPALQAIGFPRVLQIDHDSPKSSAADLAEWRKSFHANADPGQAVNLHVRRIGSSGAIFAEQFRDWLRADGVERGKYESLKRKLANDFAAQPNSSAYAEAKEPWFDTVGFPRAQQWAATNGWAPEFSG